MDDLRQARLLLRGHKCRVDARKPAGGKVCNLCQAASCLEAAIKNVEQMTEAARLSICNMTCGREEREAGKRLNDSNPADFDLSVRLALRESVTLGHGHPEWFTL
jgi:hypothetical protein